MPFGGCPDSTDLRWKKVNLFPHTNSNEFKKYCVYDWTAMGEAPDLDVLPGVTDPGDFLESDCEVLTTYGHPYTTNNTSLLESAFRAQIGQPTALPPPTAGATKVVVVDTSIDRAFPNGGPGVLDHGRAMAMLIRGLTCQGAGTCAAEVSSMLAMPLIKVGDNFQADYINGGYYGRPTDVARAIYKGVQTALASPGPNRLIINISAGWDSRWGGEIPLTGWEDLAPPIRMVYSAITYAACQGAIIIAASGNAGGGPLVETTAAYPAAWESVPAPDAGRCAAFNLAAPPASTSTYRPLVYAAGGLDGADNPLRSQRSESMPRIAAPASHATIYVGSYQTPLQTGTSVGAAVTSAAVALAWSYAPNLAGHDAMQMVYDAGADLSLTPNLCLGSPCSQSVRRISMCHTLAAACASSGRCGHLSSCEPHEPGRDLAPTGLVVSGVPVDQTPTTGTTPVPVDWPCTLEPWASTSSLDYPCPAQQLYSVYTVRYTVPQPLATICPTCIIQN
ncbi:MAG: S8/S53 family peptidase, partial [Myxococcota bacterium]